MGISSSPVRESLKRPSHFGSDLKFGLSCDESALSKSASFVMVRLATSSVRALTFSFTASSSACTSSIACFMATLRGSWTSESSSVDGRSARKRAYSGRYLESCSQMALASSLSSWISEWPNFKSSALPQMAFLRAALDRLSTPASIFAASPAFSIQRSFFDNRPSKPFAVGWLAIANTFGLFSAPSENS